MKTRPLSLSALTSSRAFELRENFLRKMLEARVLQKVHHECVREREREKRREETKRKGERDGLSINAERQSGRATEDESMNQRRLTRAFDAHEVRERERERRERER